MSDRQAVRKELVERLVEGLFRDKFGPVFDENYDGDQPFSFNGYTEKEARQWAQDAAMRLIGYMKQSEPKKPL